MGKSVDVETSVAISRFGCPSADLCYGVCSVIFSTSSAYVDTGAKANVYLVIIKIVLTIWIPEKFLGSPGVSPDYTQRTLQDHCLSLLPAVFQSDLPITLEIRSGYDSTQNCMDSLSHAEQGGISWSFWSQLLPLSQLIIFLRSNAVSLFLNTSAQCVFILSVLSPQGIFFPSQIFHGSFFLFF